MTLEIYAHLFTGDLEDIANALDRPTRPAVPSSGSEKRNGGGDVPRL